MLFMFYLCLLFFPPFRVGLLDFKCRIRLLLLLRVKNCRPKLQIQTTDPNYRTNYRSKQIQIKNADLNYRSKLQT